MHDASYYRAQANRARRLARLVHQRDLAELLIGMAQDYDDIADDLELGATEVRHPEMLPQHRR